MNLSMALCTKRFCSIKNCHGVHIVTCVLSIESLCNLRNCGDIVCRPLMVRSGSWMKVSMQF